MNCDIWADVDFGHGIVEIRCTEVGVHDDHKCVVIFQETKPIEHNVFDSNEENNG